MEYKDVVSAVIVIDGCVLATQRSAVQTFPHLWHMPGGKRELGETLEQAVVREIWEELRLPVQQVREALAVLYCRYSFGNYKVHFLRTVLTKGYQIPEYAYDNNARVWMQSAAMVAVQGWIPSDRLVAQLAIMEAA